MFSRQLKLKWNNTERFFFCHLHNSYSNMKHKLHAAQITNRCRKLTTLIIICICSLEMYFLKQLITFSCAEVLHKSKIWSSNFSFYLWLFVAVLLSLFFLFVALLAMLKSYFSFVVLLFSVIRRLNLSLGIAEIRFSSTKL